MNGVSKCSVILSAQSRLSMGTSFWRCVKAYSSISRTLAKVNGRALVFKLSYGVKCPRPGYQMNWKCTVLAPSVELQAIS